MVLWKKNTTEKLCYYTENYETPIYDGKNGSFSKYSDTLIYNGKKNMVIY